MQNKASDISGWKQFSRKNFSGYSVACKIKSVTGINGKFVFSKVSSEIYTWVEFVLENLMWVFSCLAESGRRVKLVEFS